MLYEVITLNKVNSSCQVIACCQHPLATDAYPGVKVLHYPMHAHGVVLLVQENPDFVITSYSIHYTKLYDPSPSRAPDCSSQLQSECHELLSRFHDLRYVITSYSIHYTKLYEQHYREQWEPGLFDRHDYEGWLRRGGRSTQDRVGRQIEEILADPPQSRLPERIAGKISAISAAARSSASD